MDSLVAAIVGVVCVAVVTTWLYKATRFEYAVSGKFLEIKFIWGGLFPIKKSVPLSDIKSVHRMESIREIIPIVSGTFPSLWGKFKPSKIVVISKRGVGIFPTMVTPEDPEAFVAQISPLLH